MILLGVAVTALGLVTTREAVMTWRGREYRHVGRWLREPGHRSGAVMGGRTLYQTYLGVGLCFVFGGPAFVMIGGGVVALGVTGAGDDPWWWWVLSVVGMIAVAVACTYALAYFWVGVPDGLRPRAQRGQPKLGRVDAEGRPHPLDRLLSDPGVVDLGPDPTRPPWARGDPEWTGYRPRPQVDVDGRDW